MQTGLKHSWKELNNAKDSLDKMYKSKDCNDFEKNWRDLLNFIEKAWTKSERECQTIKNKFQPWQGQYVILRKKDPLLSYLKNARHADNHSIEEIVEKTHQSIEINFLDTGRGPCYAEDIVISGNSIHYKGNGDPIIVYFSPERILCKSFKNENTLYNVPNIHIDTNINDNLNPFTLAKLGIDFYEKYLNDIGNKFFCK